MTSKVLTIDDSKTLRMIVAKHLAPFGVNIVEADNGANGLEKAQIEQPDVILLDYNMPVMDGYQTLENLKRNPATREIPVIMLTTESVRDTVMKLAKLGLKDYIIKPFSSEMLLQKVNPFLKLYSGTTAPAPQEGPKPAPQAAPVASKPTVLAIDDKPSVLRILKEYLGNRFNVITAESGQDAVRVITRTHFDYMFLDLCLPDMSGLEVFKAYQDAKKHLASGKKIIVMALHTAQQQISEAKEMGFRTILYKPFTREDVEKLAASLGAKGADAGSKPLLTVVGKVRVLTCPESSDPTFEDFQSALQVRLPRELSSAADEGCSQLAVCVTGSVLSDAAAATKLMSLLCHAQRLNILVRLVIPSEEVEWRIQRDAETAGMPICSSLEEALAAFH
jgi:two-component system cell cycle response regulator